MASRKRASCVTGAASCAARATDMAPCRCGTGGAAGGDFGSTDGAPTVGGAVGPAGGAPSRRRVSITGMSVAGTTCGVGRGATGCGAGSPGAGMIGGAVGGDRGWASRSRACCAMGSESIPGGGGGFPGWGGLAGGGVAGPVGGAVGSPICAALPRRRATSAGMSVGTTCGDGSPDGGGGVGTVGAVVGGDGVAPPRRRAISSSASGSAAVGRVAPAGTAGLAGGGGVGTFPGEAGDGVPVPGMVDGAVGGEGAAPPRNRASISGADACLAPNSCNDSRPLLGASVPILYRASRASRAASVGAWSAALGGGGTAPPLTGASALSGAGGLAEPPADGTVGAVSASPVCPGRISSGSEPVVTCLPPGGDAVGGRDVVGRLPAGRAGAAVPPGAAGAPLSVFASTVAGCPAGTSSPSAALGVLSGGGEGGRGCRTATTMAMIVAPG